MTEDNNEVAYLWNRLTNRQRIARLLLVRSAVTPEGTATEETLAAVAEGVGAFHGPPLLGSGFPVRTRLARDFNSELRSEAADRFGLEPLIGANVESGLSYTIGRGGTDVPYPVVLGEMPSRASYDAGRQVGVDLASCGYDWAFQPCVDVRVSQDDPVIGVRAFGADAALVSDRAVSYLQGIQSTGVLATAKHFPGHGDASVDSHHGLPVVRRGNQEHQEIHLAPYRAVIEAGVASIMTAHIILPDLGMEEIATFSAEIGRDLLREELGFEGLLVSDSLQMRAVSERFSARDSVIRALRGGADIANIKCLPGAVAPLLDDLEAALRDGELNEADLFRAFVRVITATGRELLEQPGEAVHDGTGRFDSLEQDQIICVTDENGVLPLHVRGDAPIGVVVDDEGVFAEPLHVALEDLSKMLGASLVQVGNGGVATDEVGALIVIIRGQSGPSDEEISILRGAERSEVPAAVLLAGPKDVAKRCSTSLPTVQAPCIDVFGIVSRSTAYPALRAMLGHS